MANAFGALYTGLESYGSEADGDTSYPVTSKVNRVSVRYTRDQVIELLAQSGGFLK